MEKVAIAVLKVCYVADIKLAICNAAKMQPSKNFQRAAIATGIGIAALGGFAYWYLSRQQWCVKTMPVTGRAVDGQEVVYSWGCLNPQRFRQWSVTATAESAIRHAGLIEFETAKNNESFKMPN
ncbi:MAG: hypothetical protein IGS48_21250 [Oscillatoriales cyanobacterium C42_A2020_001]|nr:hypothetical protein [Leptolyngbyaceae cyanobacterium C42_A2020_001]